MGNYLKPTQAFKTAVEKVIFSDHPDLKEVPHECVFLDKASGDEMGKLHIKGKLDAFLYFAAREDTLGTGDQFFVVEIAKDVWSMLDEEQRNALIDHLLCFVERDSSTMKLIKCEPDIQEFNEVVARRGKWNSSVKDFVRALQGKLPIPGEPEVQTKGEDEKPAATGRKRKEGEEAETPRKRGKAASAEAPAS